MADRSTIEWTNATWNPLRGCRKISPGCKHCYAETFAERFRGVPGHPYEQGFDLRLIPDKLLEPLRWQESRLVFANSMSDLFQAEVPQSFILAAARVMELASWHTFQVLTKRAKRLRSLLTGPLRFAAELSHVWWGVSVEDRRHGLPRIDELRATPARTRFLSIEPLLEDLGRLDLSGIRWVIVGGESGSGARPMKAEWVMSIRDQCEDAGVAFFFKQWGGVRKKAAGRLLEGRIYDEFPLALSVSTPDSITRRGLAQRASTIVDARCRGLIEGPSGSARKFEPPDPRQQLLVDLGPQVAPRPEGLASLTHSVWTENKAELIERF